ncbi:hypothetical protein BvCmsKSP009_03505 [Escherichia coli]|nr:hypothetical protein HmCmsJML104_03376 [Escherichia coli]GDJ51036.1 hypothetical protein BvCmsKSP009_03505 [Escherichia coli]
MQIITGNAINSPFDICLVTDNNSGTSPCTVIICQYSVVFIKLKISGSLLHTGYQFDFPFIT